MADITFIDRKKISVDVPQELLNGKRHLTPAEISVLVDNLNSSDDGAFQNVYVDDSEYGFDPTLIRNSVFSGFVILGRLCRARLKYHDLELETGIYRSYLKNTVTGSDNVIQNAAYLENYRLGDRVMLFNVQEMSCTNHSKFGNGILKEGESESARVWIGVGNENDGRAVLPFEGIIPADAYLWSKFRGDEKLMQRFIELTEHGQSKRLDTYGTVGDDTVIKNTTVIKDAKIGECAYIKGAFKLKNVTIQSTPDEASQIGEGVELVNGIMGAGSRVFYQAVGVRFILGRNCQLKYGARLINSILGDNSTVSCCELLNNLIFPFHEQHHNSSFLIATTILGQSNIAAGATIGSNHNSRSPDGEILAGRGFWPGLCTDFKHNCRFASFVLAAKGSYPHELDIRYPFALIIAGQTPEEPVHIVPAWWFMHDMFAIVRNKYKFKSRDKRAVKVQHIETNPLAPDTIQETLTAMERIVMLTASALKELAPEADSACTTDFERKEAAKNFLLQHAEADFRLTDTDAEKKSGGIIAKPAQAFSVYRDIARYFAAEALTEYADARSIKQLSQADITKLQALPLYTEWYNVGGQIIPAQKILTLFDRIKSGALNTWQEVHHFYDECRTHYTAQKARYALYVLEALYKKDAADFSSADYAEIEEGAIHFSDDMYRASLLSRQKDFTDPFRTMMYESAAEMSAVIGTITDIGFLDELKANTQKFNLRLTELLKQLRNATRAL